VNTVDVVEFYDEDPVERNRQKRRGIRGIPHGPFAVWHRHHGQDDPAPSPGQTRPRPDLQNAGPLGTTFEGRIVKTVPIGEYSGIVGQVRGNAQITGFHQFVVDASDPFPEGFLL
jgi:proline racemase